jgi:multiple sugar transport system ATP-binding protein
MTQLSIKALAKSYGAYKVFSDLNLDANAGEIIVVFGGSGTGKTILLRLIAGVEDPTAGAVELEGVDMTDVPPERRNVGMAFQNFALFPHMSARENIAAPLRARNAKESAILAGVDRVAKLLKIDRVLGQNPRELSNGQKQRTSLARALAAEPKFLLLDDPLRNVDAKLRYEMRLELPRLLRQSGATVLYVTQDYKEAMALADRIAVLQDGKFVQVATPADIYERPATLQVARLFGDPVINTLDVELVTSGKTAIADIAGYKLAVSGHVQSHVGKSLVMAIRPDAVRLSKGKSGFAAIVLAITPLNERKVLLLQSTTGWEFLVSLPAAADTPEPGSKVIAGFEKADIHFFDKKTGERLHG